MTIRDRLGANETNAQLVHHRVGFERVIAAFGLQSNVSVSLRTFEVSPDGQRFLIIKDAPGSVLITEYKSR